MEAIMQENEAKKAEEAAKRARVSLTITVTPL
jgi:hypothetical protein